VCNGKNKAPKAQNINEKRVEFGRGLVDEKGHKIKAGARVGIIGVK
jgi:hypothetical protein